MKKEINQRKCITLFLSHTLVFSMGIGFWFNHCREKNETVIEYYKAVENLLDFISLKDESFMDTIMETDTYGVYLDAFTKLEPYLSNNNDN